MGYLLAAVIPSETKGHPLFIGRNALFYSETKKLNHSDICSGRTFLPLLNIKSDAVTFIERLKTACVDR